MYRTPPQISVVVPCYNEAEVLKELHRRLGAACDSVRESSEIVLVNDGSSDATWEGMLELARRDSRVVCVNLSRNYGHQLALTAGLSVCNGERILMIDADLQDPPELLGPMLETLERENADVVYGVRSIRLGETKFKKWTAHCFYRILDYLSDRPIPRDVGDFRLVTRRVCDAFLAMKERRRYVRGMMSWIGYKQVPFAYERAPRLAGETHYTFRRMWRLAWDAITGFSTKPLGFAMRFAGFCFISALVTQFSALGWGMAHSELPTSGLILSVVMLLSAGQFACLGILGEYIARVSEEIRERPAFLIDQIVKHPALADPKLHNEAA